MPDEEFVKRDGYSFCVKCRSEQHKVWREANWERYTSYQNGYREERAKEKAQYLKKYYREHKEEHAEKAKVYRKEHREEIAEKKAVWTKNDRKVSLVKHLLVQARNRAKKKGVPFSISKDDIEIPTHCPVFGVEMHIAEGKAAPNSPSLDRIVPELGYVPGNVAVISHRANMLKSNATIAELEAVVEWMKKVGAN